MSLHPMNASLNSDSMLYPSPERVGTPTPAGYSPSVPISVYRELAAELKTTQSTAEALTRQNQQLVRQNKLLRNEIQRFVQAAEQLGHFAGVTPEEPVNISQSLTSPRSRPQGSIAQPVREASMRPAPMPPGQNDVFIPEAKVIAPQSAIVHRPEEHRRDRPSSPQAEPAKQRLFTEQPEEMRPLSKAAARLDLGNLWLAATILLVVVTAFGAGFLIMRPIMKR